MELVLDSRKKKMRFSGTIIELLQKLKVAREEVIVRKNGKLAPDTALVGPKDKVEVIKVVFGG